MIALLLMATAPLTDLPNDGARIAACKALVAADAKAAVDQASAWVDRDRSVPARQCLGVALVAAERWGPATLTFEQAATDAEAGHDGHAAELWSQAANAALAGDEPAKARADLDRALAAPAIAPMLAGEAWIDRARADVALDDLPAPRIDMD